MSSNQTNQVDPGDSATDLTSPLHDQADELAQSSGAGHAASTPIPSNGINDEHIDNGDGLFPGQTADEQNLEVDVRGTRCLSSSHLPGLCRGETYIAFTGRERFSTWQ
jgi:hypothetical protein